MVEQNFITSIKINNVRHLKDIIIPLSETERKHLILTGKNGSGKTTILEYINNYLSGYTHGKIIVNAPMGLYNQDKEDENWMNSSGIKLSIMTKKTIIDDYESGKFILAYYKTYREYKATEAKHIEKIKLASNYKTTDNPSSLLIKYLVDLKVTQLFAKNANKLDEESKIATWFTNFENLLKYIFDDETLFLDFNYNDYSFKIILKDRLPFGFNEMSSGYSALLDIVVDLMLRMENNAKEYYDIQGIVLIDEIETHLHIDLQKKVIPFLTSFFPNIQFIFTTHSPFILNSAENCIIYDLENKTLVTDGLNDYTISGVVQGYFGADALSAELRVKFDRYKKLAQKEDLTMDDYNELSDLEFYLDEVPDYLALEFSQQYQDLKLKRSCI